MSNIYCIWPCFIVSNLKKSISFYVEKLGFQIRFSGPDDGPYWAIVGKETISIMLKAVAEDVQPIPNSSRHEWGGWDAFIGTNDPDILFGEFSSRGVNFLSPLGINSDALRGFEVKDADGYVLYFGRPETND